MINYVEFFILHPVFILFALFLFATEWYRNVYFIFWVEEIDVAHDPNCDQKGNYAGNQEGPGGQAAGARAVWGE